jgi:hypothetical protein
MEELIQILVPMILAHPRGLAYAALVTSVMFVLGLVWQAIPARIRDAWERKYPRLTGAIRIVVELISNVLKAIQIARHQVIKGEVRPAIAGPVPTSDRYVCRQCGCYWRKNPPSAVQPDGSWSLYDAAQKSCARCDNSPDFLSVIRPAPTPGIPAPGLVEPPASDR